MSCSQYVKVIIVLILGLTTACTPPQEAKNPTERPNILLILSDDHSAPYLGCYGNPDLKTPNLDGLAQRGVLFHRAYTNAPQCVPSRATILTGRNVIDIDMSRFSAPLPREIPTIPEYLSTANYYTGICGRHFHLDGSARMPPETVEAFEKNNLVTFPERVDYLEIGADEEVLDQFRAFLDEVPENDPFFMWMNFSDPHRGFNATTFEPDPQSLTLPQTMPDTEKVRQDLAKHYGEIMRLDMHVGEVLDELQNRGLSENTQIIFMGDNGAALLRGKGTLYDMGLHVPLIVAGPGIKQGIDTEAMVCGIDIAPTVLALAGVEKPDEITGRSFYPALMGDDFSGHEYIFATRVPHSSGLPLHTGYLDFSRSVFNKEFKLIYNALWQLPYTPVDFRKHPMWEELQAMDQEGTLEERFKKAFFSEPRPMFELYDLRNDPYEFNNLIDDENYQDMVAKLKSELHHWMIVNQDYLPLPIAP